MPDLEKESFGSRVKSFAKSTVTTPPSLLKGYVLGPNPRVFDFSPQTTNVNLIPDRLRQAEVKGTEFANRIPILESFINKDWKLAAVLTDGDNFHLVWAYHGKEKVRSVRKKRPGIIFNEKDKEPKGHLSLLKRKALAPLLKKKPSVPFLRETTDGKIPPIIERSTDNYAIISDEYFNRTFLRGTNLSSKFVNAEPVDKLNGLVVSKDIKTKQSKWQQGGVWVLSFSVENITKGIRKLQRELDGYNRQDGERVKGFYEELADAKSFWPNRSSTYSKEAQDVLQRGIKQREENIAYLESLRVKNPIDLFAKQKLPEPQNDQNILQPAAAS